MNLSLELAGEKEYGIDDEYFPKDLPFRSGVRSFIKMGMDVFTLAWHEGERECERGYVRWNSRY